ncbi:MAG: DUF4157 domain-containing protein [Moorea sp. SIOASIH]|uniref:eCIS core domain-containing protein n=1 Tax=Moorena sp. SIOASIH TaxID=2607817 RepID=UPI0013BAD52E|nr:DUF4157 domain-containing protein [Moorena sp. SIOASIH]NEO40704.1 DUF4157 domain-containing protein [Moorena sp. SIOASIH]
MTRQYVRESNKSPQKNADNWILQRSAVRELPVKTLTPQTETAAGDRSGIQLDLMEIPVSNHTAMPVQAKLKIGPAGDKYEQEADRVAKQVVQQLHGSQSGKLQPRQTLQRLRNREVDEELQRKPTLQLKGDREGMTATPELESSIARSRCSGQPLSEGIREPMEKAFGGVDFSGVKVHTDGHSDKLNQSMQAKAFTTGQDVFFRQGAYDPGSQGGQELLAHELTHVVQQQGYGLNNKNISREKQDLADRVKAYPEGIGIQLMPKKKGDGKKSGKGSGAEGGEKQQGRGITPMGKNKKAREDLELLIGKLDRGSIFDAGPKSLVGGFKGKQVKGLNFPSARIDIQSKGNVQFQIDKDSVAGVTFEEGVTEDQVLAELVESLKQEKMIHLPAQEGHPRQDRNDKGGGRRQPPPGGAGAAIRAH